MSTPKKPLIRYDPALDTAFVVFPDRHEEIGRRLVRREDLVVDYDGAGSRSDDILSMQVRRIATGDWQSSLKDLLREDKSTTYVDVVSGVGKLASRFGVHVTGVPGIGSGRGVNGGYSGMGFR